MARVLGAKCDGCEKKVHMVRGTMLCPGCEAVFHGDCAEAVCKVCNVDLVLAEAQHDEEDFAQDQVARADVSSGRMLFGLVAFISLLASGLITFGLVLPVVLSSGLAASATAIAFISRCVRFALLVGIVFATYSGRDWFRSLWGALSMLGGVGFVGWSLTVTGHTRTTVLAMGATYGLVGAVLIFSPKLKAFIAHQARTNGHKHPV